MSVVFSLLPSPGILTATHIKNTLMSPMKNQVNDDSGSKTIMKNTMQDYLIPSHYPKHDCMFKKGYIIFVKLLLTFLPTTPKVYVYLNSTNLREILIDSFYFGCIKSHSPSSNVVCGECSVIITF